MLHVAQQKTLQNNFTLQGRDSFHNNKQPIFRKSLGTIPFRRASMDRANITQFISRRNSMVRQVRRDKIGGEDDGIGRNGDKDRDRVGEREREREAGQKSSFFDGFLSDVDILKNYKMMSHIGKGCFSTVSLAVHKESNRPYAIKTYQKIQSLQWYRLDSIKREIKHLKRLHHENIIQLLHVFKDKKKLFLLMDNGGKQSLSGLLRKQRCFSQEKARFYFRQIVRAICYCHSKGVCHRDLKPENILVDDQGVVRVIDFGFSASSYSKLSTFCGTPPFMSPEITKKMPYYGAGADIWALGVMLYQLVVGTLPFRATNQQQLNRLIQQGKYPIKETMSKNMKSILNRMLTCDASKRATAESILSDPWLQ